MPGARKARSLSGRRRGSGGLPLTDRHPALGAVPIAALCALFTYLNARAVLRAHGSVGSSWPVAAGSGIAFGISLIAAIVVVIRAGKAPLWPVVSPFLLMIAGLIVGRQDLLAPGDLADRVASAAEVAILALCAVLWCAFGAGLLLALARLSWLQRARRPLEPPAPRI